MTGEMANDQPSLSKGSSVSYEDDWLSKFEERKRKLGEALTAKLPSGYRLPIPMRSEEDRDEVLKMLKRLVHHRLVPALYLRAGFKSHSIVEVCRSLPIPVKISTKTVLRLLRKFELKPEYKDRVGYWSKRKEGPSPARIQEIARTFSEWWPIFVEGGEMDFIAVVDGQPPPPGARIEYAEK